MVQISAQSSREREWVDEPPLAHARSFAELGPPVHAFELLAHEKFCTMAGTSSLERNTLAPQLEPKP